MAKKETEHHHKSHTEVTLRLKRASGHLNKVIDMIQNESPCFDVLQQLNAVIAALGNSRIVLLQDHLDTCLKEALAKKDHLLIDEVKAIIEKAMKS